MRRRFKTRKEAEQAQTNVLSSFQRNTFAGTNKVPFGEWLLEWVEGPNRKRSTMNGYRSKITGTINPVLGDVPLSKLTAFDLNIFYNYLLSPARKGRREGPLAAATVLQIHRIIHKALADAVKLDIISVNVASKATPPTPKVARSAKRKGWTRHERALFMRGIQGNRHHDVIYLALATGMRRGELCGLRWDDINFDRGSILVETTRMSDGDEIYEDVPKSLEPRHVDIGERDLAVLVAHRQAQEVLRERMGAGWANTGLVFTHEDGRGLNPDGLSQAFDRLVAKSDLRRIVLHDLRHTHAHHWLEAGGDMFALSKRLGHADVSFTMRVYGGEYAIGRTLGDVQKLQQWLDSGNEAGDAA